MKTLQQYDEFQAKIDEVRDVCNFIPDVASKEGYEKSKRVSLDVGKLLTVLEKSRKDKKSESLAIGRTIDSEAKDISETLKAIQEPHKLAYKELDEAKKAREQARKDALEIRVATMSGLALSLSESDSLSVAGALEDVNGEECLDFYEYTEQALKARNSARAELAALYAKKLQEEKDAEELAGLRAKQAEQNIKDREKIAADNAREEAERAAAQATAKIEADKLSAIAAQEEAQQKAEQAEAARAEAETEAANQAKIALVKAESDRLTAVQEERDKQTAKEAAEAADLVKREANKRHIGAVRKAAKEALINIDGITEKLAKEVIMAIHNGCVPSVKINY